MSEYLKIDGSEGEGGGQILRTSVGLAALFQQPVHITKIRAGRRKPGIKRQHLTAIQAAATICGGTLQGDQLNSSELFFEPDCIKAGEYHFSVGSAGSACLVFQTVLWPLLFADGDSKVVFEGGTHNPMAPPFDFIDRCFLPIIRRMGADVHLSIESHGFMPAGGGRFTATISGNCKLNPISLCEANPIEERIATALVANLPGTIAVRELREIRKLLGWKNEECWPRGIQDARGPGNVILLELRRSDVTEMAAIFGERHLPAERVAAKAAKAIARYIEVDAPVGEYLADQLVIPFALAKGGAYRAITLSQHTQTNIEAVARFVDTEVCTSEEDKGVTLFFGQDGGGNE